MSGNPWGPNAAHLAEGSYLVCPRAECPRLDIHGPGRGMTLIAWCRRERVASRLAGRRLAGVAHRVVHGGEKFTQSVSIDAGIVKGIEDCIELAPLHNPANLAGDPARLDRELAPAGSGAACAGDRLGRHGSGRGADDGAAYRR